MPDHCAASFSPLISREQAGNAIRKALSLFVGRGRRYSVKQLSNATGIKDRVIECALTDPASIDYRPLSLEALFSIGMFLGATFTNEWMHEMRQGSFDLPDDDLPPGMIAADNSDDNATIVRAALDGSFDETEASDLRVVGSRLMSRGAKLVAIGRAA